MTNELGNCECGSALMDAGPLGVNCSNINCPVEKTIVQKVAKAFQNRREQAPSKELVDEMVDIAEALRTTNAPRGNQLARLSHRVRSEFERLQEHIARCQQAAVEKLQSGHEPPAAHPCDDGLRATECPTCQGVGGGVTRDGVEVDCSTCNGEGSIIRSAQPPPAEPDTGRYCVEVAHCERSADFHIWDGHCNTATPKDAEQLQAQLNRAGPPPGESLTIIAGLLETIERVAEDWKLKDHGCTSCVPGLEGDFLCARHRAASYVDRNTPTKGEG